MNLASKKCIPCEVGGVALTEGEARQFLAQVEGWDLEKDATQIEKEYRFKDFAEALTFVQAIGQVAESEGHHPDIDFGWGRVHVRLTTHSMKGLSENDFIVAAKIDALPRG